MPQAFGGAVIAALVLSPEGLGGITASLHNQLQRSINILLGRARHDRADDSSSANDWIDDETAGGPWCTGWQPTSAALTLAVSVVTFTSRKTNVLQGCIHLLLFAVFVLLIFAP